MTATSTEDRAALADAVRSAAARSDVRHFLADDDGQTTDSALWTALVEQIGITGLLVAEDLGGSAAGVSEATAVLAELAAQLSPVPALASLGMAGAVLAAAGGEAEADELRGRLAEGAPATVAWPHPGTSDLSPVLRLEDGRLHGEASFVMDGMVAEVIIAPAEGSDGVVLVAVEAGDEGVRRSPMSAMDVTRGLTSIAFDEAPATVLTRPVESADPLGVGFDIALTCIAAEQVAIASRCHSDAVAWARERVQFDRVIGSFQAIKHTLVDLLQELELARSSLDVAVAAADAYLDAPDVKSARALRVAASAAKAMCGDAATRLTDETLHVFGGIGFTWEHDAHLYFRRARTLELLLGSPDDHRMRLAATLGVGA